MITENELRAMAGDVIARSGLQPTAENYNRVVQAIVSGDIELSHSRRGFEDKYSHSPSVSTTDSVLASMFAESPSASDTDVRATELDSDSGTTREYTPTRRQAQQSTSTRSRQQPARQVPSIEDVLSDSLNVTDLRSPTGNQAAEPVIGDYGTGESVPAPQGSVNVEGVGEVPSPIPEPVYPDDVPGISNIPVNLQEQLADTLAEVEQDYPELVEPIEEAMVAGDVDELYTRLTDLAEQLAPVAAATAGAVSGIAAGVYAIRGMERMRRRRGNRDAQPPGSRPRGLPEPPTRSVEGEVVASSDRATPRSESPQRQGVTVEGEVTGRGGDSIDDMLDELVRREQAGDVPSQRGTRAERAVRQEIAQLPQSRQPANDDTVREVLTRGRQITPLPTQTAVPAPATAATAAPQNNIRFTHNNSSYVYDQVSGQLLRAPRGRTGQWESVPADEARRIVAEVSQPAAATREFKHGATVYTVGDDGNITASNKRGRRNLSPQEFEDTSRGWKRTNWSRKKAGDLATFLKALRSAL